MATNWCAGWSRSALAARALIASALFDARDREKALAAGFDGYFSKPISPETFVHEIAEFCARAACRCASPRLTVAARIMAKVLVIDDSSANRELVVTVLESQGHSMIEAGDGAQGLALAVPNARNS